MEKCPRSWMSFIGLGLHAVEATTYGIAPNHGKTRMFGWSGAPAPPEVATLGANVWRGDKSPHGSGFVVFGMPVGHPAFLQERADERLREEQRILSELPELLDSQCAWLLLVLCAAHHALRTIPPAEVARYAASHDATMWETFPSCVGGAPEPSATAARQVAVLPAACPA